MSDKKSKGRKRAFTESEKAKFLEAITDKHQMEKYGIHFSVKAALGRESETMEDVCRAIEAETAGIRERLRVLKGGKPH
jgi:hypothetical protein